MDMGFSRRAARAVLNGGYGMYERCDRSYLELIFPKKVPEVTQDTRLIEDLHMNAMAVRLLTAYIQCRYGGGSRLRPEFKTIGDIDAYIFYEYDCERHKYW
jgi:hypothetical protein